MTDNLEPKKIRRYGYVPDLPDPRDQRFSTPRSLIGLPSKVDLSKGMPGLWDQLDLGSCTAHAALACYQFTAKEQKQRSVNYSRLFQYYVTRQLENTVEWDSGASIRNSIKAMNKAGVCLESDWKYDQKKFNKRPPQSCFDYASRKILRAYARVNQTEYDLKSCLAQENPITFGFSVFQSFEGEDIARTGVMKMPTSSESVIGGHAVCLIGYNDAERVFLVRNSWGDQWGLQGNFTMPYEFVLSNDLCDDFWTVLSVP